MNEKRTMKNDGGPAFPQGYQSSDLGGNLTTAGMSLRDYFAAQAMTRYKFDFTTTDEALAIRCYSIADAMLTERVKMRNQTSATDDNISRVMVEGWPILNDNDPCRKCGFVGPMLDYHVKFDLDGIYDWFEAKCMRCRFQWFARPIDTTPPKPQQAGTSYDELFGVGRRSSDEDVERNDGGK